MMYLLHLYCDLQVEDTIFILIIIFFVIYQCLTQNVLDQHAQILAQACINTNNNIKLLSIRYTHYIILNCIVYIQPKQSETLKYTTPMSMLTDFNYSQCLFQARLQKSTLFKLRKKQQYYLYVSPDCIIINREPYSKKPEIILKLLPTTHVKWLWQHKRGGKSILRGFIIQTQGYMNQFAAQPIVLDTLKIKFKQIALQSQFYDEYVLGHYIDKGNYAQVFQCTRKDNGQKYAVKILQKQRLKNMKNGKQSVFNELKILRNLKHENLMRLYQVFEDRNKFYIVLQLLQGITLYKQIQNRRKNKQLKPQQIRGIIKQILLGVEYMYAKNIMHRDIKPQNILFQNKNCLDQGNSDKGLKIVDYGLATFQHEKFIIFTKCGTPGFVAPQIITYDEKQAIYKSNVDIFSVGVIMHILLVGEQSFAGRSRNTILNKNKQCRIDYKSKKYQAIASDGIDLLSKMLQKSPQKRINPTEALNHPFLTMDRPIFKFKKSGNQIKQLKLVPMKMYKNLQQVQDEVPSPTKISQNVNNNQSLSTTNTHSLSYYENSKYFSPFCYDHQNINTRIISGIAMQDSKQKQKSFNRSQEGERERRRIFSNSKKQNSQLDSFFNYS